MNEPSVHLPPPAPGLTADVGESRAHAEHEAWDAEIQRLADVMLYAAQVLRIAQVQSGRNSAADVAWRTLNQAHEAMTKLLGNE